VTIQDVMQSVPQSANHQNATHLAKNQRTPFAMLNVKDQIVKLCAQIKLARLKNAPSVSPYAKHLTVSPIANHQSLNARLSAKNQNAIGSALNLSAQNQNVNWFVKIPDADQRLNAANVTNKTFIWELVSQFSKKWKRNLNAVIAIKIALTSLMEPLKLI
jgi:hypothetical protein